MDYDTFKNLALKHNVIPVTDVILADTLTPVSAYMRLRSSSTESFLLESVEGNERVARYSFLGSNPVLTIRTNQLQTTVTNRQSVSDIPENYFDYLRKITSIYNSPIVNGLPRFSGGLVGCIGYDLIRHIEKIPSTNTNDNHIDDAILGLFPTVLAFDHIKQQIIIVVNVIIDNEQSLSIQYQKAIDEITELKKILSQPYDSFTAFEASLTNIESNVTIEEFSEKVKRAKEFISAGDIFQVVLSQRFGVPYNGDVFNVYRALRVINPSPYMYYLDFADAQIIGSSPEILVRKEGELVESYPIAGTRKRGVDPEEDLLLEKELLNDEKECAEHIMLVDLGRNDIGRVCIPGTVKVNDFMSIVRYSHVMHIASRVYGNVKNGASAVDVFTATFPAGTVSGAPKVRAMEIIDELEQTRRGIYAGGVGYFDFSGNMDMCIAIRTFFARNGVLYFQTGAGIVADSNPEKEYEETINKSMALRRAVDEATRLFGNVSFGENK